MIEAAAQGEGVGAGAAIDRAELISRDVDQIITGSAIDDIKAAEALATVAVKRTAWAVAYVVVMFIALPLAGIALLR